VVLILGIFTLGLGGLLLIIAELNRANEETRGKLNRIFLYAKDGSPSIASYDTRSRFIGIAEMSMRTALRKR
jgi:hypothetical protein